MGHSQMNIDSGMPTQFIVTYDGDPELSPVLPWLNSTVPWLKGLADQGQTAELTEEEAQEKFADAVGRMAPFTDTSTKPCRFHSAPSPVARISRPFGEGRL